MVEAQIEHLDNYFYRKLIEFMDEDEIEELDAAELLYQCKLLLRPELQRHFPSILEEKEIGRFNNALRTYAVMDLKQERPLLMFDNTIFSTGKDGFLLTDKNLYIKDGSTITWKSIKQIECGINHITINKQRISLTWSVLSVQDIQVIEHLLKFCCIAMLAYAIQSYDGDGYKEFMDADRVIIDSEEKAVEYSNRMLAMFADSGWSRHVYALSGDTKVIKKMQQAVQSYAQLSPGEIPLIVYDNTAFGSGKDGCLLTNQRIFIKNMFSAPKSYLYDSISVIELKGVSKELFINGFEVATTMLSSNDAKVKFCAMLNRIKNDLAKADIMIEGETSSGRNSHSYSEIAKSLLEKNILGKDLLRKLFLYEKGHKSEKKFQNACSTYALLESGEVPLLLFDDTAFGSAKQGLLLSSEAIYVRNTMSQGVRFRWNDIHTIELRGVLTKELFINNYKVDATLLNSNELKTQFCELLNHARVVLTEKP
ncbi:hypothetical protein CM49_03138 [Paenibacillus sp. P1XP2]|nr:hypothetical protein CM49_03138 [Paenibacillus sp. P1XP2]